MNKKIITLAMLLMGTTLFAQRVYTNYGPIDIKSYEFHLAVNDSTNSIQAHAILTVLFKASTKNFTLDFENRDKTNKGMVVDTVTVDGDEIPFVHANNQLNISFSVAKKGVEKKFRIVYHGVPKDGLVISKSKFGDRTFFGDNWPNRARQWLPTADYPLDKALVSWYVTAPAHYQVVANGTLVEESNIGENNKLYVYKTTVPIPTKVMVVGVARFAVEHIGETHGIPVSSWVYPQDKKEGFYDYAIAKPILNFFIEHIGPYPFSKLANVQSKTRFGGMENAGNIFYTEKSVSGKRTNENLFAHEIAHQWFGNSATENDWTHLWLSEGFATYFTNLYVLKTKGTKAFIKLEKAQRDKIINFHKRNNTPVLDSTSNNLMSMLNANSYEKGGWFLHMLRHKVGDAIFWKSIRAYYKAYAYKNASTNDLKNIFEKYSKQDLDAFFKQWLEKAGHPVLKTAMRFKANTLTIEVDQVQSKDPIFFFPLDIKIIYKNGHSERMHFNIRQKKSIFTIQVKSQVKDIILDPDTWLLFEQA